MPLICHSFGSSPQSWTEVFATALLFCTCWTNSQEQMKIHIPYTSFLTTKNVAHEHYLQVGVPTRFLKRITQVFTNLRYYRLDARAMLQSRGVNTYTNMWEILATLFRELQLSLDIISQQICLLAISTNTWPSSQTFPLRERHQNTRCFVHSLNKP